MGSVECKKCGKEVFASEVRYISPNEFACEECFLGYSGKTRKPQTSTSKFDASPIQKESLKCDNCGFVTKFKSDGSPKVCSYCGSKELVPDGLQASQLIADSDDLTDQ